MKKWKVYIFYLHITDDDQHYFDVVKNNDVYAYTTNKKIANEFIKVRDMNKFYLKKYNLNKDDLNILYHDYMNHELVKYFGITRDNKYNIKEFSCVLTKREITIIEALLSRNMHERIYKYLWTEPKLFKGKYYDALNKLLYVGLSKYITEGGDGIWEQTEGRMLENLLSAVIYSIGYLLCNEDKKGD